MSNIKGTTLLELVVVVALSAIMGIGLVVAYISGKDYDKYVKVRDEVVAVRHLVIKGLNKYMREAKNIEWDGTKITIIEYNDDVIYFSNRTYGGIVKISIKIGSGNWHPLCDTDVENKIETPVLVSSLSSGTVSIYFFLTFKLVRGDITYETGKIPYYSTGRNNE